MTRNNLVICDKDRSYAGALALYLTEKKEFLPEIHVCTEPENVKEIEELYRVDILLISDEYPKEQRKKCLANKKFLMYSGKKPHADEDEILIFKYQSGEKILTRIIEGCGELLLHDTMYRNLEDKEEIEIIGVFSPVHRIGKTAYALALGEKQAEQKNVLYLNLELYCGIQGHFEDYGQAMADVLYHARQEKQNLGLFLTTTIQHCGNVDVVAGMVSEDMKKIHAGEWISLIKNIIAHTIYDVVILDIDEGIPEVYELLGICTRIYLLTKSDPCSQAKIRQFEKEIALLKMEEILNKTTRVSVEQEGEI